MTNKQLTSTPDPVEFLAVKDMSFFVAKFDDDIDEYIQYSIRMSFENAKRFCDYRRNEDPQGIYKVFCDTEY